MSKITDRINSIISTRKSRVSLITNAIENLEKCNYCISQIRNIKNDLDSENSKYRTLLGNEEAVAKIQNISLDKYYKLSDTYKSKLNQLVTRFNRDSLHISFVGSARQGKSLVIQNISGLDKSIIPSSQGTDCTGAKSIITNSSDDNVIAKITFYNDTEMIGIINNYLEKITHGTKYNIYSLNKVHDIPLEQIKVEIGTLAEEQGYLLHLKNYVDHFDKIQEFLGRTITVPKEQIEEYVAQYNHDNPDIKYWNYLGVKLADINCRFQYEDAGKIVLLDTIGIGTTSLGVEDSMLDTVENDSDAIVFMFRPDPLGPKIGSNEIKIISMISDRVGHDYAKEMLFWVINKVESGTGENVKFISGVIDQINGADLPVSEILQVNCSSKENVESDLLVKVLNKMSERINVVDKLLIEKANIAGNDLYAEFDNVAKAFERGRLSAISSDLDDFVSDNAEDTIDKVFNQLRDLYKITYQNLRDKPCEELKEASKKTLFSMFSFVPNEKKILELLNKGTINQHDALAKCTDRMRLDIIDAFSDLDNTLEKRINDMKREVLEIFVSDEYGRLGAIDDDISDPCEWIDRFVEKIQEEGKYPSISEALIRFKNFRCSVQGFMIFEVRGKLDNIDFELRSQTPKLINGLDKKEKLAQEIYDKLMNELEPVHNDIETIVNSLYKTPNRAMFAAIKDLYDRACKEERESKTNRTVQKEWKRLYKKWAPVIWSDEYKDKMSSQEMAEEFNTVIDSIKECNKKNLYEIGI